MTPAELFSRAYRDEERVAFTALLDQGRTVDEAAAERWRARAAEGWTPGEIGAVLVGLVEARLLRELAARFEGMQRWGPPVPVVPVVPGAARVFGEGWPWDPWHYDPKGRSWVVTPRPRDDDGAPAPLRPGESIYPTPPSDEWLRLRARGRVVGKLFKAHPDEGWRDGSNKNLARFTPELVRVAHTVEAWAALFESWQDDSEAFLVRGIQAREADGRGLIYRAMNPSDKSDGGGWIAPHPVGRRELVLDIDDRIKVADLWPDWPGFERWPTNEEAAELVRRAIVASLPAGFHDAAAAYRFSSSAGVPGGKAGKRGPVGWSELRCHVAIILDRPVYDDSLHAWLKRHAPKPDACVSVSAQPLYLASPLFEGEAPHWPSTFSRVGILPGVPVVKAPPELADGEAWRELVEAERLDKAIALETRRARREVRRLRAPVNADRDVATTDDATTDDALEALAIALEALRLAVPSERHPTLYREACDLGRLTGARLLDRARAEAELFATWQAITTGRDNEGTRTIRDGLDRGEREPMEVACAS